MRPMNGKRIDACDVARLARHAAEWVLDALGGRNHLPSSIAQNDDPGAKREMIIELADRVKLELVWCRPGSFVMGSERSGFGDDKPPHYVMLGQGFWIGKYPVTQLQWKSLMQDNPSTFKGDSLPVEKVSWYDCQAFIARLNEMQSGTFRLPSEAEWEYACRAGTDTEFYFGNTWFYGGDKERLGNYAWYDDNSKERLRPVGRKRPNNWGLYDTSGNVWEWCEDWYHDTYLGAPEDGRAWVCLPGKDRVSRGGSYRCFSCSCRAAFRAPIRPEFGFCGVGLRLVRSP